MHHLDTNQELSKHQCDFRKGHCTVTTWLKIKNNIIKAMERGEVTLVVMGVDFEILMQKLHELNLSKCSLKILACYLLNRRHYVHINEAESQLLLVTNCVPQGSILGPVLFNINVYDTSTKTDAKCIHYADDTSLYRYTKPTEPDTGVIKINSDAKNEKKTTLIFNSQKTFTIF